MVSLMVAGEKGKVGVPCTAGRAKKIARIMLYVFRLLRWIFYPIDDFSRATKIQMTAFIYLAQGRLDAVGAETNIVESKFCLLLEAGLRAKTTVNSRNFADHSGTLPASSSVA